MDSAGKNTLNGLPYLLQRDLLLNPGQPHYLLHWQVAYLLALAGKPCVPKVCVYLILSYLVLLMILMVLCQYNTGLEGSLCRFVCYWSLRSEGLDSPARAFPRLYIRVFLCFHTPVKFALFFEKTIGNLIDCIESADCALG